MSRPFSLALALQVFVSLALASPLFGQSRADRPSITVGGMTITGIPHDWTQTHVVYSNPGTEEEAIRNGAHDRWLKVVENPRYILQQLSRREPAQGPHAAEVARILEQIKANESSTARMSGPGAPLKFEEPENSWDELRSNVAESDSENWSGPVELVTAKAAPFYPDPPSQEVETGRHLMKANATSGVGLIPPAAHQDWALGSSGAFNGTYGLVPDVFAAKYTASLTTASCANDFVIFPTGYYGTATQATIVAYNNLYSGCTTGFHTVYWAYNTGTGSAASLSPNYSLDGTQVLFTQYSNASGNPASLVLLKWTASGGSLSAPVTPTLVSNANYRACTAPCMTTIAFSNGYTDDLSNVFYDYGSDTAFVGDIDGYLHKFSGLFNGTPAEVGSPWPVLLTSGYHTGTPVMSEANDYVYVGDFYGYLWALSASTGTGVRFQFANFKVGYGSWDAPLIDPISQSEYFFLSSFVSNGVATACTNLGAGCKDAVAEFYPASQCPPCSAAQVSTLGRAYATNANTAGASVFGIQAGTFDHLYLSSSGSNPSGNIYAAGNVYGPAELYRVPVTNNVIGAATTLRQLGSTVLNGDLTSWGATSPVQEFYNANAAVDYIFVSSNDGCTPASLCGFSPPCAANPAGCVEVINGPANTVLGTLTTQSYSNTAPTGGFIIDNDVPSGTLSGASEVYFMENYTSGSCSTSGVYPCAVQASQAALH